MKSLLRTALILAALATSPIRGWSATPPRAPDWRLQGAEVVEIFACDFEEDRDANYDRWPDQWTRQTGPGYPRYLRVEIEEDCEQPDNQCLGLHLDGGAAAAMSPPIRVSPFYSYLATCRLRTEDLRGHAATLQITAFDDQGEIISQVSTPPYRKADKWTRIQIGPWTSSDEDVRYVVLSVHLEPDSGSDLFGAAYFDDVTLARVPHISLAANAPLHWYTDPTAPTITCRISGIQSPEVRVQFRVLDALDRCLASEEKVLVFNSPASSDNNEPPGRDGQITWRPPLSANGFYRVTASVQLTEKTALERSLTLIVYPPLEERSGGDFGWSFPEGDARISIRSVATLAEFAGLGWIKFPVWFAANDKVRADELAWLAERMSRQNIQMVGILDTPPPSPADANRPDSGRLPAALAFAEPQVWQPLVDPVLTRLALKTRWWQLGSDYDTSYLELPDLEARLRSVNDYFRRFSQDCRMGLAWPWLHELPPLPPGLCSFYSQGGRPSLTATELQHYLTSASATAGTAWVRIEPLPADRYDVTTRVRDLTMCMMAAKKGRAATIMLPDPFHQGTGVLFPDGTPRELLLPWTILARNLGKAEYVGEFLLPAGSTAYVFERNGQAILVLWNEVECTEKIFLGDPHKVRLIDLWGKESSIEIEQQDEAIVQVLPCGRIPILVTGANLPIARLRMDFAFNTDAIPSIFGREQNVELSFTNHFSQGIGGTVTIHAPNTWSIAPQRLYVRGLPDERQSHTFQVRLGTNSTCGEHTLRFDFDLRADERYRFSVFRPLHVGLADVTFELHTYLDDQGTLFVEQHLINRSDRVVNFNCLLFLPNYKRQRLQMLRVPRGRHIETYVVPNGESMVGQNVWLRAEEIAGQGRVLNFQGTIEP